MGAMLLTRPPKSVHFGIRTRRRRGLATCDTTLFGFRVYRGGFGMKFTCVVDFVAVKALWNHS
jgi:hypothetical protein